MTVTRPRSAEDDFFAQEEAEKRWAEAREGEGRALSAKKLEQARIAALPRAPAPARASLWQRMLKSLGSKS